MCNRGEKLATCFCLALAKLIAKILNFITDIVAIGIDIADIVLAIIPFVSVDLKNMSNKFKELFSNIERIKEKIKKGGD